MLSLSLLAAAAALAAAGCSGSAGGAETTAEGTEPLIVLCPPWGCSGLIPPPPTPITLATGSAPCGIAVDASDVYWTDMNQGTVQRIPIGGGTAVTLASGQPEPGAIALLPQNPNTGVRAYVYWANTLGSVIGNYTPGAVMGVAIPNAGLRSPFTLASGQAWPQSLAIPNDQLIGSVFWSSGLNGVSPVVGSIVSAPVHGGATATLSSASSVPTAMTVDNTNVYWAENGLLLREPLAGGAVVTLASGFPEALMLAVDASNLYVGTDAKSASSPAAVVQVPLNGGAPITLATASEAYIEGSGEPIYNAGGLGILGIAVDASYVYYLANSSQMYPGQPSVYSGAVMRVPIGGGTPVTVASGQSGLGRTGFCLGGANTIAVDSTNVYWTMAGDLGQSVMQVAK